jgi:transposase, IS30 family
MKYYQITSEERYTISTLRRQGYSVAKIAQYLERHPSSIYREVRRNSCSDGWYRPSKAARRTRGRRSRSRRNRQFTPQDYEIVEGLLREDWSPEQISGYLKDDDVFLISHETIYRYIWRDKQNGGSLYLHLRCSGKQKRKRYGAYDSRGRLAGKRHISERPKEVEKRQVFGHWEVDTVAGQGSKDCIVTLVERKSGLVKIGKLKNRTAKELNRKIIRLITHSRSCFKTITADNGTEFHGYKKVEKKTGVPFYFATPYHSWERGTNENTNGLIRQYLPKGMSMKEINQDHCNYIADKLNSRPRKRHGFKSPAEVLYGE